MDDESMDRKTHGCMPPITHSLMRPKEMAYDAEVPGGWGKNRKIAVIFQLKME